MCKLKGLLILMLITGSSNAGDDYEMMLQHERESRASSDKLNGLYKIQSVANGLYLTAKEGRATPGPVRLNKFVDAASQLWQVTKFDTSPGYNLKPLGNDYNSVTSTLKDNAHAYNAWDLKKQPDPTTYMIVNKLDLVIKCLEAGGPREDVRFEQCRPTKKDQIWKLHPID